MALPYHDSLSSIFLALFALENQSNKEPVKSITERYIKNKPSTILAVLGAHYDRQMQEITKMATIRTENAHSASLPDQIQRSEVLLRNKHGSHWPRISSQGSYFTTAGTSCWLGTKQRRFKTHRPDREMRKRGCYFRIQQQNWINWAPNIGELKSSKRTGSDS